MISGYNGHMTGVFVTAFLFIASLLSAHPETPYSFDTVISYNYLSEYQQGLVDRIYESISEHEYYIGFGEEVPEKDLDAAIENIMFDYPELFYIDYTYDSYYYDDETMISDVEFSPVMSEREADAYTVMLFDEAEAILSHMPSYLTDYEKELWIYRALAVKIDYSTEDAEDYTPAGALLRNKAACEGYAEALTLLLRLAGIPCSTVSGTSYDEAHEWNIVRIGDDYTLTDLTLDDMGDYISYQYFNVTDEIMERDHQVSEYYKMLPEAVSMKWNWHARNGLIFDSSYDPEDLAFMMIDSSAKTSSPIELRFTSEEAFSAFISVLDEAYQDYADSYGDIEYWTVDDPVQLTYAIEVSLSEESQS